MSGKFALIIGNTEYIDPGLAQLTAPGKDAEDFARVLKDQEIGAFDEVNILLNQPEPVVRGAIDEFFDLKKPDDLLVLYFSGHGVRDELGSLYLAVKNTIRTRLRSTAVKSNYIREAMDQSRSKRQVVILDCCNSGAFPQGTKAEVGGTMGMVSAFQGYGRYVLTASDEIQFAWEGNQIIGETDNSLFTHFLLKGLQGEADGDSDGRITVDELYDYAFDQISKLTPKQTPRKDASKQEGEIVLRQIMRIEDIKPVPLPTELNDEIEDSRTYVREAAVQKLEKIIKGRNIGLARSAREALEKIAADDDSRRVSQAASQVLESIRQVEQKAEEERRAREEAERLAALRAEEERLARETAEAERKAKEEAEKLLRAQAEREAAESEAARLKAERETAEKAAREATEKAAKEKAEKEAAERQAARLEAERESARLKAEHEAAQKAEREAMELASRKKAEREAAEKAEREAIELATRKKAEREAKERVAGKESKATRPSWLKFGVIGGVILTLCLCGYAVIRFFPMFFVVATEAPSGNGTPVETESPAATAATQGTFTPVEPPIVTSTSTEPILTPINKPPKTSTPTQRFFTEEFNTSLSNDWSVLTVTGSDAADVDKVTVETRNGKLVWNFDSEWVYYYLFYEVFRYTDVKVDVRANNLGRNNNNISLICRYNPNVGWYEFNIANNGLYDIYYAEVESDGDISYNRITNGGSNDIKQGQAVNDYSISCAGNELSLTINGEVVNTIAENTYGLDEGYIGISVSSFNVLPILIEMDWVKIREP